jgi:general secretion pathway protein A
LQRAECSNFKDLFSKQAVEVIWTASKGSPRTINVLCDHSLVNAFAMGKRTVEGPAAREAVQDVLCLQIREPAVRKPGPYLVTHLDSRRGESDPDPDAVNGGERRGRVG